MPKKKRGNGQGSVYKRGATYTAEVCIYTGDVRLRLRKGGFATKREALAYLPELRECMSVSNTRTISFVELFERWTSEPQFVALSGDKQCAYRVAYRKLTSLYGCKDFRECGYEAMSACITGMNYYPARDIKRVLNGMSQLAIRLGCAEQNYAELLQLPRIPTPNKSVFTEEQVKILKKCGLPFADVIVLMITMGLRPIEMRTMSVCDVHLDEHYVDCGRKTSVDVPIAIPAEAEPFLLRLCERAGDGLVCKMSEEDFYEAFYQCLADVCIQDTDVHTLTPVSCRHTFVTRLTKRGLSQAMIQKAARHTSYKTTQTYTHIDITDVLSALDSCG